MLFLLFTMLKAFLKNEINTIFMSDIEIHRDKLDLPKSFNFANLKERRPFISPQQNHSRHKNEKMEYLGSKKEILCEKKLYGRSGSKKEPLHKNTSPSTAKEVNTIQMYSCIFLCIVFLMLIILLMGYRRNYQRLYEYLRCLLIIGRREAQKQLECHLLCIYEIENVENNDKCINQEFQSRSIINHIFKNWEISLEIARLASSYQKKLNKESVKKTVKFISIDTLQPIPKTNMLSLMYKEKTTKFRRDFRFNSIEGICSAKELKESYNVKNEEIIIEMPLIFVENTGEFIQISFKPVRNTKLRFKNTMEIYFYREGEDLEKLL